MNPLVVYCVSGGSYLTLLNLSLDSLFTVGEYSGAVLVEVGTTANELFSSASNLSRFESHVAIATYAEPQSVIMARFLIHQHAVVRSHGPILYVDADIIFDRPVLPMLESIFALDRISFAVEQWTDRNKNPFMGSELIKVAELKTSGPGINNGMFGLPNGHSDRYHSQLLDITMTTMIMEKCFPRLLGHTPDQAVTTFIEARDGCFDLDCLTRYVKFTAGEHDAHDPSRRGAVHFLMNETPKIDRMRRYLGELVKNAQAG